MNVQHLINESIKTFVCFVENYWQLSNSSFQPYFLIFSFIFTHIIVSTRSKSLLDFRFKRNVLLPTSNMHHIRQRAERSALSKSNLHWMNAGKTHLFVSFTTLKLCDMYFLLCSMVYRPWNFKIHSAYFSNLRVL